MKEPKIKLDTTPEKPQDPTNRHFKILIGIGIAWIVLFIVFVETKLGELRAVLPLIGLFFLIYLVYATRIALKNKNK